MAKLPKKSGKSPRRICITGTAASAQYTPWDDESVEIWAVGYGHTERLTRHIEPHRMAAETPVRREGLLSELKAYAKRGVEVWSICPVEGVATHGIPADALLKRFGTYFMTSSFSWAMALALFEMMERGIVPGDTILLRGVDMEFGTEYRAQRSGLRHFIEVARLLGVEVDRLVDSGIVYDPIPYPVWQDDPLTAKTFLLRDQQGDIRDRACLDRAEAERRVAGCNRAIAELRTVLHGAEGDARTPLVGRIAEITQERDETAATLPQLRAEEAHAAGALKTIEFYLDYLQP